MGDLSIRVDPASTRAILAAAKTFDRALYLQLRRRIRAAAAPVVADVKREVLKGGPSKTGLRAGIAAGTSARLSSGKKAGVTIQTSSTKMPAGKQSMVKAWNRSVFRHPVRGDRDVWVSQAGNPYFDSVILQHRIEFQKAFLAALQDTLRKMET